MDLNKTYDFTEDESSDKENKDQFNGKSVKIDDTVNTLIDQLQVLNLGKASQAVKKKFNLSVWSTPLKPTENINAHIDTETNFDEETWSTPLNVANERNVGKKQDVNITSKSTQNTKKKLPYSIEFVSSGEYNFVVENTGYPTTKEGCNVTLEESTNYEDTTKGDKSFCLGETFANKMSVECSDSENKYSDHDPNISLKIYKIEEETVESFPKQDDMCLKIKSELNSASNTSNSPKTLRIKEHSKYDYYETIGECSVDSWEVSPKIRFTTEGIVDECLSAETFEMQEIRESYFNYEPAGFPSNDYKIVHEEITESKKQVDSLILLKKNLVDERLESSSSSVKQQKELENVSEIDAACPKDVDTFCDAEEISSFSTNYSEQIIENEIKFANDKSRIMENELFLQDSKNAKDEEFPSHENLYNSSENELELYTVVEDNEEFYGSCEKLNEEPARECEWKIRNETMDEKINKSFVKQEESVTKNAHSLKKESTNEISLKEEVFVKLQPPNEEKNAPCETLLLSESYLLEENTSLCKAHIGDNKSLSTTSNNFISVNTHSFSPEEEIVEGTYESLFCLDNTELNLSCKAECSNSSVSSLSQETSADFRGSDEVNYKYKQVVSQNTEEDDGNESVVFQNQTVDAKVDKLPPIDEIFRYCLSQNSLSSETISHTENANRFLEMCQNFPIGNDDSAGQSIKDDKVVKEILKLSMESENRSFDIAAASLTGTDNIESAQSCDCNKDDVKENNSFVLLHDENVEFSSKDRVPKEQREILQTEALTLPEKENAQALLTVDDNSVRNENTTIEIPGSNLRSPSCVEIFETEVTNSDIRRAPVSGERIDENLNVSLGTENCTFETYENNLELTGDNEFSDSQVTSIPSSLNEKEIENLTSENGLTSSSTEILKSEHDILRDKYSLTEESSSSSNEERNVREEMEILESNDTSAPCHVLEEMTSAVRKSGQFCVCLEDRIELSTTCAVNEEDTDRRQMLQDKTSVETTCEFFETNNQSLLNEKEIFQNEILSLLECTVVEGEHCNQLSITNDARSGENKGRLSTVIEENEKECIIPESAMLSQNYILSTSQEPTQSSNGGELTPEDEMFSESAEVTVHSAERLPENIFEKTEKGAENTSPCESEISSETDSVSSVIENPEYSIARRKSIVHNEPMENLLFGPTTLELTNENILSPFMDVKFEMPTGAYSNSMQIPGTPLGATNSANDRSFDEDLLLRTAKVAKLRENINKLLTPLRDNLVRFRTPRADTRPSMDESRVEIPNRNCEQRFDDHQKAKLVFEFPTNLLDLSIDVLESLTAVNHAAVAEANDQVEIPKEIIAEEVASFVRNDKTAESQNIPEYSGRTLDVDVVAKEGTPKYQSPSKVISGRSFCSNETLKTELEQLKSKYEESQKEYEKLADITLVLYHNESSLKKTLNEMDEYLLKSENKYQLLKEYANEFIMQLNVTIDEKDLEIKRLQKELKKLKDSKNK